MEGIYKDDLMLVTKNDQNGRKKGFVDIKGNEIVPCIYTDIKGFSEQLAAVKNENGWGFINTSGKVVIPCQYLEVNKFENGKAGVRLKNESYYIDKTGKRVN